MISLEKVGEQYFLVDTETGTATPKLRVSEVISGGRAIPDSMAKHLIRGTRVHRWTEIVEDAMDGSVTGWAYLAELPSHPELYGYVLAWSRKSQELLCGEPGYDLIGKEMRLFSPTLDFAGTADRVYCKRLGLETDAMEVLLLDIKTTTQPITKVGRSKRHAMQLGAYGALFTARQREQIECGRARWSNGGVGKKLPPIVTASLTAQVVYIAPTGEDKTVNYTAADMAAGYKDFQKLLEERRGDPQKEENDGVAAAEQHRDFVGDALQT